MRDNKYYAIARGVSEGRIRLITLCVSAIFPGLAGGFYGSYLRVASPDVFGLGFLTITLSILLLGGISTIWRAIIAAFVITILTQVLGDYGAWRAIIIAVLIIAVVVIYPGGLFAALQEAWGTTNRLKTNWIAKYRRNKGQADRAVAMGFKDKLVQTSHGEISVCDSVEGNKSILFIHGNSSSKEAFRHQFAEFSKDYRVVAFDLPGHGVSPNGNPEDDYNVEAYAQIAVDIVTKLNLDRPFVFGWSLGGYVGLEYVANGSPATGLAICGTSPINKYPDDIPRGYIPTPHMELAGKRFHSPYEKKMYASHTVGFDREQEPILWDAVWRTDGLAREQAFAKLKTINWPRQTKLLREGNIPFAMINGSQDPFINHEYCSSFVYGNIWKGAPQSMHGYGHAPFVEKPDEFNSMLRSVLKWMSDD